MFKNRVEWEKPNEEPFLGGQIAEDSKPDTVVNNSYMDSHINECRIHINR